MMVELRASVCRAFELREGLSAGTAVVRVGRAVGGSWDLGPEDTLAEVSAGRRIELAWGVGEEGALLALLVRIGLPRSTSGG